MKLLLDTHIFLWLQTAPERLGAHLQLVADRRTELLLSAVSSWEIAIKHSIGRLPLPEPPERYVPDRMRAIAPGHSRSSTRRPWPCPRCHPCIATPSTVYSSPRPACWTW